MNKNTKTNYMIRPLPIPTWSEGEPFAMKIGRRETERPVPMPFYAQVKSSIREELTSRLVARLQLQRQRGDEKR